MPYHLNLALDNGVKAREISEIITHLAFYSGWANAMSAVAIAKDAFAERRIGTDQLPAASGPLLPLDQAWETQRATRVEEQFGAAFPGMVRNTTDILFRDLWLRPDLAPRDRSLVTVSALVAGRGRAGLLRLRLAMTCPGTLVSSLPDPTGVPDQQCTAPNRLNGRSERKGRAALHPGHEAGCRWQRSFIASAARAV